MKTTPLIAGGLALLAQVASPPAVAAPRTAVARPIAQAGPSARVEPSPEGFQGAIQRFAWQEGGLYQIYLAPGRVSDIVLQPGEQLVGSGPVAAGDTARWIIGDTLSGSGEGRRVHVMVKPTLPGLSTNLVINTDRRTYYLELHAMARAYMASVAWTYPEGSLLAPVRPSPEARALPAASPTPGIDATSLNFDYRIVGPRLAWRPVQAFDDGKKAYIVLPASIATNDLPPLFLLDESGRPQLVNYRVVGRQLVVDRLFERAELRLGDKHRQRRVRIERLGVAP